MLNVRDQRVLALIADGLTDREIATELHISERTIRRHVENVYHKIGAINRPNAVHLAWQKGWLS